jgi:hypothetical protein
MATIGELVTALAEWVEPEDTSQDVGLRLASTVDGPASGDEIEAAWGDAALPAELVELWRCCRSARLFVDVDYGQWGLRLLTPAESAERTAQELVARAAEQRPGDVVVAEFLGDLELVVVAGGGSTAAVLVALPLDERAGWWVAAPSVADFLATYLAAAGDKFWEERR